MVTDLTFKKIGVLGGSFNPAHRGHLGISLCALQHLDLDMVWWLVTPKNPLKTADTYAPIAYRVACAETLTADYNIEVHDVETDLQSTYTVDVIHHIKQTHTHTKFIWLMGADNMVSFHMWHRWADIVAMVPIAVFSRPNTGLDTLQGCPCYDILHRVDPVDIWQPKPRIWTYVDTTHFTECATHIRQKNTQQTEYKDL